MLEAPRLSIMVLVHNHWDAALACLASIACQSAGQICELLLINNGSTQPVPPDIHRLLPEMRALNLPENLGFAGGMLEGLGQAQGDWVALLNSDVILPPNFVAAAITRIRQDPSAALLSPYVESLAEKETAQPKPFATMSLTGRTTAGLAAAPDELFGYSGCSFWLNRRVVSEPFLREYFLFHEDTYLAWLIYLRGLAIVHMPECRVRHHGSLTAGGLNDKNRYYLERNRRLNFALFATDATWQKLRPLWFVQGILDRLADVFRGRRALPVIEARRWLRSNRDWIAAHRDRIQSLRAVGDEVWLGRLSCRLLPGNQGLAAWVNRLSCWYCWWRKIPAWEMAHDRTQG
jgi:hypothetical protein